MPSPSRINGIQLLRGIAALFAILSVLVLCSCSAPSKVKAGFVDIEIPPHDSWFGSSEHPSDLPEYRGFDSRIKPGNPGMAPYAPYFSEDSCEWGRWAYGRFVKTDTIGLVFPRFTWYDRMRFAKFSFGRLLRCRIPKNKVTGKLDSIVSVQIAQKDTLSGFMGHPVQLDLFLKEKNDSDFVYLSGWHPSFDVAQFKGRELLFSKDMDDAGTYLFTVIMAIRDDMPASYLSVQLDTGSSYSGNLQRIWVGAEHGDYLELDRNQVIDFCADTCRVLQMPPHAGSVPVYFSLDSKPDSILALVAQKYVPTGDYTHWIWVPGDTDPMAPMASLLNVQPGKYEPFDYTQNLVVDIAEWTEADKIWTLDSGVSERAYSRSIWNTGIQAADVIQAANQRSKMENLDTCFLRVPQSQKWQGDWFVLENRSDSMGVWVMDTSKTGYRLPLASEWEMLAHLQYSVGLKDVIGGAAEYVVVPRLASADSTMWLICPSYGRVLKTPESALEAQLTQIKPPFGLRLIRKSAALRNSAKQAEK
jgi:hypothetical protein